MGLLITGAAGMLGHDVVTAATASGHEVLALSRAELDITDPATVESAVAGARADVVLNCAAWTDVDGAEAGSDKAFAVSSAGAGNVARAAMESGAWVIHVSSDYVFSDGKCEPYLESDPTEPSSAYGRSKLGGEVAVAHAAPGRHTIVRSSWLFGTRGGCSPRQLRDRHPLAGRYATRDGPLRGRGTCIARHASSVQSSVTSNATGACAVRHATGRAPVVTG
jgi:dTDP-4-dehydrorhamnose reductase